MSHTAPAPGKTDSAARGGAIIMLARVIGMACGFVLFAMLARQSELEAGVFRTVATFMVIAEFLGLLGTQRWLAVEVAPDGARRWQLFVAGSALAVGTGTLIALVYAAVSFTDIYGHDIARGLQFAVLSTVAAALLTNVQTLLVGIGFSRRMGQLNLLENVVRSLLSIGCLLAQMHVLSIIVIFVICRWLVTLAGMWLVVRELRPIRQGGWWPETGVMQELLQQIPRFALIMGAFLLMRNAAMIMLPALVDEREVALFAVPYQIYDLALLVPSILAISTNYLFARQASRGRGALRWVVVQLWSITSAFVLPLITLAFVFGSDMLRAVFSHRYDASLPAFYLLMCAVPLMALDQVLSQTMQSARRFREDALAVCTGAVLVLLGTLLLGRLWGATGAAATLLAAIVFIVGLRLYLLGSTLQAGFLLRLVQRPLLACILLALVMGLLRLSLQFTPLLLQQWAWLPLSAGGLLLYVWLLRRLGALRPGKRARVRKFLFIRHEANSQAG